MTNYKFISNYIEANPLISEVTPEQMRGFNAYYRLKLNFNRNAPEFNDAAQQIDLNDRKFKPKQIFAKGLSKAISLTVNSMIGKLNPVVTEDPRISNQFDFDLEYKTRFTTRLGGNTYVKKGTQLDEFCKYMTSRIVAIESNTVENGKIYYCQLQERGFYQDPNLSQSTQDLLSTNSFDAVVLLQAYMNCQKQLPLSLETAFDKDLSSTIRKQACEQLFALFEELVGDMLYRFMRKVDETEKQALRENEELSRLLKVEAQARKQSTNLEL